MFKKFNDPAFLLEVFYDYNEEVGGKMRIEDQNEDKFTTVCQKYQHCFDVTKKLQDDKMNYIKTNTNRVTPYFHN